MLFPALDEEDLNALADNIKEKGLIHPVVLDRDGRVIDGRNRLKACEIAGVEPAYTTYEGDDPDGYVLSANAHRRNLTKGQLAMITAKACPLSGQSGRPPSGQSSRFLSGQLGISRGFVGKANVVLQHAPDLVDPVISGATGLNEAYATAQENKAKANSAEVQLARLREEDPELADRVVEGHLTLAGAWAERTERVEEDKRQRRVATRLLDEIVPPLAQTRGTRTFSRYDPAFASGSPITREIIAHATTALAEMDQIWQERDLP
ncbi:plasmid replication/partition related protein [Streptomyces yokosukanensis]|uniref:Plasmid replication/partition related protein n=1 Tax=Streptomyces yokosukanensis TaxID=67386 RepID=A0A101NZH4_9ACTN|nr:plasmid replication/partition related protein [Streptomyces yokosukanensis]